MDVVIRSLRRLIGRLWEARAGSEDLLGFFFLVEAVGDFETSFASFADETLRRADGQSLKNLLA